jgi:hypothetical protein
MRFAAAARPGMIWTLQVFVNGPSRLAHLCDYRHFVRDLSNTRLLV